MDPENETEATPAATVEPVSEAADTEPEAAEVGTQLDDLDALRAEVNKLRKENAAARVKRKEAVETASSDLVNQIGQALGLIETEEPLDVAALTTQLGAEREAAHAAQLNLAVYRAANTAGVNADALLDSRTFLQNVSEIDVNDTDALNDAITQAVTANPALKIGTAVAPTMKPNPAQGSSAKPPMSLAEQAQAAQAAGNTREALRLKSAAVLAASDQ